MEKSINRDKSVELPSEENQPTAIASNNSRSKFWQRVLLVQGIGWVGALGILGSSIGWTTEPTSNPGSSSTVVESLPTTAPIETNLDAPRRASARSGRRLRARMQRQRQRQTTAAVNNNNYIDTTDYSLGATRRRNSRTTTYDAPSSVVMTERSTRRQTAIVRRQRAIEAGESVARRTRLRNDSFSGDSVGQVLSDRPLEIPRYRSRVGRLSRRSQIARRREQPTQFGRISRRSQVARRREQPAQFERSPRRLQIAQFERSPRRLQIAQFERSPRQVQSSRREQINLERSSRRREMASSRRPVQIPIASVAATSESDMPTARWRERIAHTSNINNFRRRSQTAWRSRRRDAEVAGVGQIQIGSVTPDPNQLRVRHWNGIKTEGTFPQRLPQGFGNEQNSQPIPTWPGLAYNTTTNQPQEPPRRPSLPIAFPLSIPAQITSVFGWRIHPISNDLRFHTGTDIGAPIGTPVVAAYPGRVALADTLNGYGLTIILQHNDGTQETRYAHLSEVYVESGDFIEQGTTIGRVGNTGTSTGPHLHFELREQTQEGWVAIDPGVQIESSLARLLNTLQIAQSPQSEINPSTKLAQPKPQLDNRELPEIVIPNTPGYFVPPLTGG